MPAMRLASTPLLLICALVSPALAATPQGSPFTSARPAPAPVTLVPSPSAAGGFLAGADDCAAPHRVVPAGDQMGVAFTTGTTGTQGQNESLCDFFGTTGIDFDVWFDWTATQNGIATVRTCSETLLDTKLAVWPGTAGCPTDGSALSCNEDACGLQSSASWAISAGTSYTIQVGTFPGAQGGSGSFSITQSSGVPCGIYDDGTTENALALNGGGEVAWMHYYDCTTRIDEIQTAYGTPLGGTVPNGQHSWICAYEDSDCDGDPTTGPATLLASINGMVMNSGLNVINVYPFPVPVDIPSGCSFVLASADVAPGDLAAPMDESSPTPRSWIVGNMGAPGSLDVANLNTNSTGPFRMQSLGFQTAFVLRAAGSSPDQPQALCFGDGSGAACPCGNDGAPGSGCANSTGAGAALTAAGLASVTQDSFELQANQVPNQPGIFFQGDNTLLNPPPFGAGLRCCGMNVVRWITVAPASGCASTQQPGGCGDQVGGPGGSIAALGGLAAGDTRCYQYWYRDPSGVPCPGESFNLSHAVQIQWQP